MASEALPDHIGPYRVLGPLGRGGMGEVLRGHDDRLDRPVALKRVRLRDKGPQKARQRFQREARIVARLSHPSIVQIYDWEEAEGDDWLVMELIEGRPLDAVLKDGPLAPKHAVAIAREIASGLAAAHESGLVHRDLKAGNVMVTLKEGQPDQVKILDFGIAKKVDLETAEGAEQERPTTLTEAGQVIGTVRSMSPEQALGYPVDHRSDLFSLGTLLYEMLSGVSPFEGANKLETLNRICSARETPLLDLAPDLPVGLTGLVGRLLEKEPARRPVDAREVLAQLDLLTAAPIASGGVPRISPIAHGTAGPEDATLEVGKSGEAKVVPATPDSKATTRAEEDRGTYSTARLSFRWALALIAVMLIAFGLRTLLPSSESPSRQAPAASVQRAPPSPIGDEAQPFSVSHQQCLALLERFDLKEHLSQAVECFEALVARYPESAAAYAGLAQSRWREYWVLKEQRSLDEGLQAAERAVELEPYLASAHVSYGLMILELGDLEAATTALDRALRLDPSAALAHRGLGQMYEARGEAELAERAYLRGLEVRPQDWDLHDRLGTLYFRQSRYDEAASSFQKSLAAAPDNVSGLSSLSGVFFMQGRIEEAAAELQKAIAIRPHATLYTNLGNIFFFQGSYEQAIAPYRNATERIEGKRNPLMWGNLGDAYRWSPGYDREAREAYQRGIVLLREDLEARPGDLELQSRLALYLARSGESQEPLEMAQTLEATEKIDASTLFRLVMVYEQCGERSRALASLEQALAAGYPRVAVEREQELDRLRADPGFRRLQNDS